MFQLGEAWNQNMDQQFFPSWINVIDDSMMEWFNKWDNVFMCVDRKLHPFANEWHIICCALTSILWRAHIVEVKDRPTQLGPKKKGKIWGRLLGLCYEFLIQSFQLVSVLCVTVTFLCQRVSQPCWSLVYNLLSLSRSANNVPRVYRYMPFTNTYLKICYLCGYFGGHN